MQLYVMIFVLPSENKDVIIIIIIIIIIVIIIIIIIIIIIRTLYGRWPWNIIQYHTSTVGDQQWGFKPSHCI